MADYPFLIRYEGREPDEHFLPAYEAGMAIAGVARTATLVTHYLIEGDVRKRAPFSESFQIHYLANRPGSFEELFRLVMENPLAVALGTSIGASVIWDAIKLVTSKVIGKTSSPATDELSKLETERPGDLDALAEAVEPSVKSIHAPIGGGTNTIVMVTGGQNTFVFDAATKRYVNSTVSDQALSAKRVSIGSFNVNTRYGRCFDQEHGRTIPFVVVTEAKPRAVPTIGASLSRYASRGDDSWIYIQYRAQRSPEGQVKRYLVYDAWVLES